MAGRTKTAWTAERLQQLAQLAADGYSLQQAADFFHVSRGRIGNIGSRYGIRFGVGTRRERPQYKGIKRRLVDRPTPRHTEQVDRQPRLCQRPALGVARSLTAALMGDPRPGRTPWAAE